MWFTDLTNDAGLKGTLHKSYIHGYAPSQADVKTFQAIKKAPEPATHPPAYRWYKHIKSFESEFPSLPGDSSKEYTAYGPETSTLPINSKALEEEEDDDEEIDIFGSDEDEDSAEAQEAARIREERLAEYKKKKEGKAKPAAKSVVTLDVKPWDDETDMQALENSVRSIEKDGLQWAGSKLVAVGFGIRKLQINLVVEDEKVSIDELQEEIELFEDYVQSSDVAAMQKL